VESAPLLWPSMTTKLTSPLIREIELDGEPFTVTISADGVRLARKRFRSGRSLSWRALWARGADELEQEPRRAGR
jgi:hypothetical protein